MLSQGVLSRHSRLLIHLILAFSLASLGCSCGAQQESEVPPSSAAPTDAQPAQAPSSAWENTPSSELKTEEPPKAPALQEENNEAAPASCDDPKLKTHWIGENVAPTSDWWRPIANVPPRPPPREYYPGARAPIVRIGLSSAGSLPDVTRKYRQNFGRFRMCYEASLSKDPKLAGHWLARVAHSGKVCTLQVTDTTLPQVFSECLAEAIESHVDVPDASGLLEVVLAFQPR